MIAMLLACVDERAPSSEFACAADSTPAVGSWTSDFEAEVDCVCSTSLPECHSLWRGSVSALDGDTARLRYMKHDGTALQATVGWWLVAVGGAPSCVDLYDYEVLASGTVAEGASEIEVSLTPWSSDYESESWSVTLLTGGADHAEERLWFAPEPIALRRSCE